MRRLRRRRGQEGLGMGGPGSNKDRENRRQGSSKYATPILFVAVVMVVAMGYIAAPMPSTSDTAAVIPSTTNSLPPPSASLDPRFMNQQKPVMSVDRIWKELLLDGKFSNRTGNAIVMEIGVHELTDGLNTAKEGYVIHCVEPSIKSYARMSNRLQNYPDQAVKDRLFLHQTAAGSVTGRKHQFLSEGGTGDRIGSADVWKMEAHPEVPPDPEKMVEVVETRMDDILLGSPFRHAYLVKIDTQGFEPHVLAGFSQSLKEHRIDYLIMEYWPKGIDFMTAQLGDCSSVKLLKDLVNYGYQLYQLPAVAHPSAPEAWLKSQFEVPVNDFETNCKWYYDLEKQYPATEYKMGYWSDILAVSPEAMKRTTQQRRRTSITTRILKSPDGTSY